MNFENFRPLKDRILVERLDPVAHSGIIFAPDIAVRKEGFRGRVKAIGRKVDIVQIGDIVHFGQFTDFDNGQHCLIQEGDVRGIEEEELDPLTNPAVVRDKFWEDFLKHKKPIGEPIKVRKPPSYKSS